MFWIIVFSVIAVVLIGAAVYDRVNSGNNWKARGYAGRGHRSDVGINGTSTDMAAAHLQRRYQGSGPGNIPGG